VIVRPRVMLYIVGGVATGIVLYRVSRVLARRRSPKTDNVAQATGTAIAIVDVPPAVPPPVVPPPAVKPRIVRTNTSEFAIGDGWSIRMEAYRERTLRRPA
jgi:hypothetical protein